MKFVNRRGLRQQSLSCGNCSTQTFGCINADMRITVVRLGDHSDNVLCPTYHNPRPLPPLFPVPAPPPQLTGAGVWPALPSRRPSAAHGGGPCGGPPSWDLTYHTTRRNRHTHTHTQTHSHTHNLRTVTVFRNRDCEQSRFFNTVTGGSHDVWPPRLGSVTERTTVTCPNHGRQNSD